jgi:glycosyltransferase involved in cell wall biosynthesis
MVTVHKWRKTWTDCIDGYIALSDFARSKFVEGGLPPSKIFVKPNFVQPDPGIGNGQQYAVFLGRLHPEKGIRGLLSAWKLLRNPVPLLVVGDGPLRQELQRQAATDGLSTVKFCGQVEHSQALSILKMARFLIVPSECYENFPCAIAEAYACGIPVLASSLGALKELVQPYRTGLQFSAGDQQDLADTIDWAWSHPEQLRTMGRAARAEYEARYSAERNYSLLMDIYDRVMATRGRRPHEHLDTTQLNFSPVGLRSSASEPAQSRRS